MTNSRDPARGEIGVAPDWGSGFEASVREAPPLVRDLSVAVRNLEIALRLMRNRFARELGLSANEYTAVMTVSQRGDVTPRDLALELNITSGAVTTLLDRLTKLDLVERRPHPEDRRSILVALSDRAEQLKQAIYRDYFETVSRAAKDNPDLLHPRLVAALRSLSAAVEGSNSSSERDRDDRTAREEPRPDRSVDH